MVVKIVFDTELFFGIFARLGNQLADRIEPQYDALSHLLWREVGPGTSELKAVQRVPYVRLTPSQNLPLFLRRTLEGPFATLPLLLNMADAEEVLDAGEGETVGQGPAENLRDVSNLLQLTSGSNMYKMEMLIEYST